MSDPAATPILEALTHRRAVMADELVQDTEKIQQVASPDSSNPKAKNMALKSMQAIIVDQSEVGRLSVRSVAPTEPRPGEVTIRVRAISLNRGETKRALTITPTGTCPGWDFAGVVETTNGVSGAPDIGTRVVGVLPIGAWAEQINAPLSFISVIPDGITDAQASTLPVAGLTALHGLRKGGSLLGRKVLINGATGGVGQAAIQLAAASGAKVYAHIRQESQRVFVEGSSTGGVVVGPTLESARSSGPFDVVIDSVGGSAVSAAMTMLRRGGTCVVVGRSEGDEVSFDISGMFNAPGASLQSLVLFEDIVATESASHGLAILLNLVKDGLLKPIISIEAPWTQVASIARQLVDRRFAGKAVLMLPQA